MEALGKSPIPIPLLILGKCAMVCCWLFVLVKEYFSSSLLYDDLITQTAGISLGIAGLLFVIFSFVFLGKSVSVGLPEEKTELKTGGVYQISRNPMYTGAFVMCAGSCLYSIHFLNIIFFLITAVVHHCIVLKEEKFLEDRFGEQWIHYSKHVFRYLGRRTTPL